MNASTPLLSTAYLPPLSYYAKILASGFAIIEQHEHYIKQTYRNRCLIGAANGALVLSIPIEHGRSSKQLIRDVKIDSDARWEHLHQKSILAAYKSAPFYDYYIDDLFFIFQKKHSFLFDLNLQVLYETIGLLQIQAEIVLTDSYQTDIPNSTMDYRNSIHPKLQKKKPDNNFTAIKYYQGFSQKNGFLSNLSIIDLLFNEGPNALAVLRSCIKTETL